MATSGITGDIAVGLSGRRLATTSCAGNILVRITCRLLMSQDSGKG